MIRHFVAFLVLILSPLLELHVWGATIAYDVPSGVIGNQSIFVPLTLGMDFDVLTPISVTALGVFDSNQDGLLSPLVAGIYDRQTQALVTPPVEFVAGTGAASGILDGGSRFLPIPPVVLPAGFQGTIAVYGYGGTGEQNANSGGDPTGTAQFPWVTNDGGGLISFVGSSRNNNGQTMLVYPENLDSGPVNRYAAGTFTFAAIPEPSTLVLILAGASLFAVRARRNTLRQNHSAKSLLR